MTQASYFARSIHMRHDPKIQEQSGEEIQLLPRVIVFATAPAIRVGMQQLLQAAGAQIVALVSTTAALEGFVSLHRHLTVVSDAEGRAEALQVMLHYRTPLLVLAVSEHQRRLVAEDITLHVPLCSVVDAATEDAVSVIMEALIAIASGERFVHLSSEDTAGRPGTSILPPLVALQFRSARLPPRCVELLWLDVQGYSTTEIAQRLMITEETVRTYWKRAQRRLELDRTELRAWVKTIIDRTS